MDPWLFQGFWQINIDNISFMELSTINYLLIGANCLRSIPTTSSNRGFTHGFTINISKTTRSRGTSKGTLIYCSFCKFCLYLEFFHILNIPPFQILALTMPNGLTHVFHSRILHLRTTYLIYTRSSLNPWITTKS
jgi:hypothetical protein